MVRERLQSVDRQLDDRDVRRRKQVSEDAPSSMIEAPLVTIKPAPSRFDSIGYFFSDLGRPSCRILEREQFGREAVEIVNRPRPGHCCYGGCPKEPVCGDDEQGSWLRQFLSPRPPRLCEAIHFKCVHRASVTDE